MPTRSASARKFRKFEHDEENVDDVSMQRKKAQEWAEKQGIFKGIYQAMILKLMNVNDLYGMSCVVLHFR